MKQQQQILVPLGSQLGQVLFAAFLMRRAAVAKKGRRDLHKTPLSQGGRAEAARYLKKRVIKCSQSTRFFAEAQGFNRRSEEIQRVCRHLKEL